MNKPLIILRRWPLSAFFTVAAGICFVYLAGCETGPNASPTPSPSASPTASPSPDDQASPSPDASPSPSASPSPVAERTLEELDQSTEDDYVLAYGDPVMTVVEYGDFECGFCGRFDSEVLPTVKRDYIDTGRIRWIYRHFPIQQVHPHAERAAVASECAGDQGAFWQYHELLFQNQLALEDEDLISYAAEVVPNLTAFEECFADEDDSIISRVNEDELRGVRLNISSTPGFLINDRVHTGLVEVEIFTGMLDEELAEVE